MPSSLLSKSKYLNGLQCPRLLWTLFHEPEKVSATDAATQYIFDQGHVVGGLAKKLYPDGIDIPADNFTGNIRQTQELLRQRKTLFEAGIAAGNLYARVDILEPVGDGEWDIIEVKSSTSVKDVHIHDASFQRFCCKQYGLAIRKCFLLHINNKYIRHGEIDPKQLFTMIDITDKVDEVSSLVQDRIHDMSDVILSERCPDVPIGKHCSDPYECALTDCWDFLPEDSVFDLYRGGQKSFDLVNNGILSMKDIPDDFRLDEKQRIQKSCVLNGQPYIDRAGIREFISTLRYPLYYLDFETFSTAIPMFDSTRPYQNIPFQFSLHVQGRPGSEPGYFSFLDEGSKDPRPDLVASLNSLIGSNGSIVAYNKSFEEGVLKALGDTFPAYADWTKSAISRLVDLIVPFRSFHYYHPSQKGSASLKSVLPAVTGQSYEGMEIAQGDDASMAFLKITYGEASDEERRKTREQLLAYCKMDTEGMVRIIKRLEEIVV